MEHILSTGLLDLLLVILGVAVGSLARFKTPIMLTIFLIRLVKWYFETHPQGKKIARETDWNDKFNKKFSKELKQIESSLGFDNKEI